MPEITEERREYGNAWELTGLVISLLMDPFTKMIQEYPRAYFPWGAILNKLIRALFSPTKLDHWVDIQGYAQLMINELRRNHDIPSK